MYRKSIDWEQPNVQRAIDDFIAQTPGTPRNFSQLATRLTLLTNQKCYRNTVAKKVQRILSARNIVVSVTHPIHTCTQQHSKCLPPFFGQTEISKTAAKRITSQTPVITMMGSCQQSSLVHTQGPNSLINESTSIESTKIEPTPTSPSETNSSTSSTTTILESPGMPPLVTESTATRFPFVLPMFQLSNETISSTTSGISNTIPLSNFFVNMAQTWPPASTNGIPNFLNTVNFMTPLAKLNPQLLNNFPRSDSSLPLRQDAQGRVQIHNAVLGLSHRLVPTQLVIPVNENKVHLYVLENPTTHNYVCLDCLRAMPTFLTRLSRAIVTLNGEVWVSLIHATDCRGIKYSNYMTVQIHRYQKREVIDEAHIDFLKSLGLEEHDNDDDILAHSWFKMPVSTKLLPPPTAESSNESIIQVD